jgi:hypothetical protein
VGGPGGVTDTVGEPVLVGVEVWVRVREGSGVRVLEG